MTRMMIGATVAALALLTACGPRTQSLGRSRGTVPALALTTDLRNASGESLGTATLSQEADGVRVTADVIGLAAGDYAMHLHSVGKCEAPGFTSAGPHFNPAGRQHGHLNPAGEHAGDLPNIRINDDGRGRLSVDRPGLRLVDAAPGATPLIDADGAAVVLHAAADDYRSDPAGNAGARVACGVLTLGPR